MFSLFKQKPIKKLNKQLSVKLEQAMYAQRNGDIRSYSQLSAEAEEIDKKIVALENKHTT